MRVRTVAAALLVVVSAFGLPASAATNDQAAFWREDLRSLVDGLERTHPNLCHSVSRGALTEAVADLDRRIPTLQRHEIIVEMARIVAMIGDGHTNLSPVRDARIGFRSYPLRFALFEYRTDVSDLISLSFDLARAKRIAEAFRIQQINVERNPGSADAHAALGELYLVSGQKDLARAAYTKALALEPRYFAVQDRLASLGVP